MYTSPTNINLDRYKLQLRFRITYLDYLISSNPGRYLSPKISHAPHSLKLYTPIISNQSPFETHPKTIFNIDKIIPYQNSTPLAHLLDYNENKTQPL